VGHGVRVVGLRAKGYRLKFYDKVMIKKCNGPRKLSYTVCGLYTASRSKEVCDDSLWGNVKSMWLEMNAKLYILKC
jgi:hypothetical protein